jgi:hypothetical protein
MPASARVEVVGVKDTIKALRQVDPECRKEFNRGIKDVVAPMVATAKGAYPAMPLSGMQRAWVQGGSQKLPWEASKVRSGVKVKTSTRRNANSVVYITQANPAGAIFEIAGEGNRFGAALRSRNGKVLWPTYDRYATQIAEGVDKLVREAERTVQGMVRR